MHHQDVIGCCSGGTAEMFSCIQGNQLFKANYNTNGALKVKLLTGYVGWGMSVRLTCNMDSITI